MSRLFKNIAYNLTGQGLVLILGFVGVKFVFSRLGGDAFGVIYFNLVLTGVLTTALELGLLSTTVREVSAHFGEQRAYVERLVRTASLLYWGVGVALLLAVLAAAPFLVARWVNLKTLDAGTATTMLRVLSVTIMIALPRALYASLFQGRQRMEVNNGIDVGSSAVQQLGIIAILARGGDAYAVVVWMAASAVLSTATYMALVARMFGARALVPAYFSDVVKRNAGFTAHLGLLSLLNMVLTQFDKVLVSKLQPIASVGYYSFASTVVVRISFVTAAITRAALPAFSSLHQLGHSSSLLTLYRKLQDLICYGMAPLFAALTFGALPLYTYLFNREVAWLLLPPTALICLGYFMSATVNIPYTVSVASGRPDIASRSNLLALLVVIPITTVLTFRFGLAGAACSWVVYHAFLYAYMIPRICREVLVISASSWYLHILKVFALVAVTYGSLWVFLVIPGSYSTLAVIVAYVIASALFLVGTLVLIGPDLKSTIWRLPQQFVTRNARSVL